MQSIRNIIQRKKELCKKEKKKKHPIPQRSCYNQNSITKGRSYTLLRLSGEKPQKLVFALIHALLWPFWNLQIDIHRTELFFKCHRVCQTKTC